MTCYSSDTWIKYRCHEVSAAEAIAMEDHLRICDHCLNLFIASVTDDELAEAAAYIPSGFSTAVSAKAKEQQKLTRLKSSAYRRQKLISYYTAAAILTLMFMTTGLFQSLVEVYPQIESRPDTSDKIQLNLHWAEPIVDKTSSLIKSFELFDRRYPNEIQK